MAFTVWFTGLPCAGKTTIAKATLALFPEPRRAVLLDGDEVREDLCVDLGFAPAARDENIRRIAAVARLLNTQAVSVLVAAVSPCRDMRESARRGIEHFYEVYVSTSLAVCEARDVKGHYAKARALELRDFTGVGAGYEPPEHPDLVLDTANLDVAECVARVRRMLAGC